MRKLMHYFLLPLINPGERMRQLSQDDRKVWYGFLIYVILGGMYTITVWIGYQNGFGAVTEPLINIPAEEYYYYQTFFQIPVFIIIAVVFAGTARLASVALKGKGSFESIFAISAVGMTLPMLVTLWIPETALLVFFPDHRLTPLGGFALIPVWLDNLRMIAGAVWMLVIIVWGVKICEGVPLWKAILISLSGGIPMGVLLALFIR